jgi:hypothetical protein
MEEAGSNFRLMSSHVKSYIEQKTELNKLKLADTASTIVGNTALYAALAFVGAFALLLFSFALAYGLGAMMNNYFLGFLLVTLLYVIIGMVVWFNKEKVFKLPMLNAFVGKLFNKEERDHGKI